MHVFMVGFLNQRYHFKIMYQYESKGMVCLSLGVSQWETTTKIACPSYLCIWPWNVHTVNIIGHFKILSIHVIRRCKLCFSITVLQYNCACCVNCIMCGVVIYNKHKRLHIFIHKCIFAPLDFSYTDVNRALGTRSIPHSLYIPSNTHLNLMKDNNHSTEEDLISP